MRVVHKVGVIGCPQGIWKGVQITNAFGQAVQVATTGHSALSVDAQTLTIAAGATRDLVVSFNCSTQTAFIGLITVTATSGSTTDAKTV